MTRVLTSHDNDEDYVKRYSLLIDKANHGASVWNLTLERRYSLPTFSPQPRSKEQSSSFRSGNRSARSSAGSPTYSKSLSRSIKRRRRQPPVLSNGLRNLGSLRSRKRRIHRAAGGKKSLPGGRGKQAMMSEPKTKDSQGFKMRETFSG